MLEKAEVALDIGPGDDVPTGDGLLAFSTMEEAIAGINSINADYVRHSAAARALAKREFDASKVLGAMLERIGA